MIAGAPELGPIASDRIKLFIYCVYEPACIGYPEHPMHHNIYPRVSHGVTTYPPGNLSSKNLDVNYDYGASKPER